MIPVCSILIFLLFLHRLPPSAEGEWWELVDESRGIPYYYHTKTNETVWERPDGFVIPLGILQVTCYSVVLMCCESFILFFKCYSIGLGYRIRRLDDDSVRGTHKLLTSMLPLSAPSMRMRIANKDGRRIDAPPLLGRWSKHRWRVVGVEE